MFKKIILLALVVSIFSATSSVSIFAQKRSSDETQTISQNKPNETKSENLRETLLKKKNQPLVPNFEEKDNLNSYQKQKSQGKGLSKSTKILIGVGVGVAVLLAILITRFGINE